MNNKHEYLMIGGRELEVTWHGPSPADAPTLVFLHEGLGCIDMWRDFPAQLARATGCGALVYSRFGYGRSAPCELPRPVRYLHEEALNVLPELLRKTDVRECVLIGHSDGGSIGIIYAGGTPAVPLRGLITVGAHVFCEDISVRSIRHALDLYQQEDLRAKLEKYHGANTDVAFLGWNDVWLNPDFMHWNLEEYLPGIKVPMLVIQGENDQYGTTQQVKSIVDQAGAGAEALLLPGCGHHPHQESPEETLRAMKAYVLGLVGEETALP